MSAYKRGVKFDDNAFDQLGRHMPMHGGWQAGWLKAGMIRQTDAR